MRTSVISNNDVLPGLKHGKIGEGDVVCAISQGGDDLSRRHARHVSSKLDDDFIRSIDSIEEIRSYMQHENAKQSRK